MSEDQVDTKQLYTLKVYRIDNGWVTESREGQLAPKVKAFVAPAETLDAMFDWFGKAGIGAQKMRKLQGLRNQIQEVLGGD
jgi:hypothetical protein